MKQAGFRDRQGTDQSPTEPVYRLWNPGFMSSYEVASVEDVSAMGVTPGG